MNPDFMPTDYDNGTTRRMGYVFDGLDGVELRDATTRFETALRTFWKSKCVSTKIIYFNKSMDKLANEFYPIHCPDLPWCPENRAEVLARMYIHQGRFLKYEFASTFFKEKYIIERFTLHQHDEDYHAIVVGAIQDTFDIVENGGRKKSKPRRGVVEHVNVQRVKALTEENASLLAKVKELQTVNQQLKAKQRDDDHEEWTQEEEDLSDYVREQMRPAKRPKLDMGIFFQ